MTHLGSATMRALLLSALLIHVVLASKITIYESDDALIPYSPEAILGGPLVVIFQSSVSPSSYRPALVPAGLKDDLIKTDPAYQDLAKVLSSDQELSALYADMSKLDNRKIFDIPLPAGDMTAVPSSFKVANFALPPLPLMFITHPKDLQGFDIKNIKQVGQVDV